MTTHSDLLPRYLHLREVQRRLNHILVERLKKDVLDEGGKKLGILKKNVLVLDTEDEIAVLMDYCLYDVRRRGLNAVERYLEDAPPAPDSDEMRILKAMKEARFSLVLAEAVEPGTGVSVRDTLRGGTEFVMDVGFSRSVRRGAMLAVRLITPDQFSMTTGAALPVGLFTPDEEGKWHQLVSRGKELGFSNLSPPEMSEITAAIIRACLQEGAASRISYGEPNAAPVPHRTPPVTHSRTRVGRNDPCPCGSGKKFKKCCGAIR